MTTIEKDYQEIKTEIETFVNDFNENENLSKKIDKYYKGTQVFFTPLVKNPTYMFIGINPGLGFSKSEKRNVKRFSPLEKSEYSWGEYALARETRKLFELANISKSEIDDSVKSNCFFFATKNEKELYALLSNLKQNKVYTKSEKWIDRIAQIVSPKIIICEGKSAFDRFTKNKDCKIEIIDKVLYTKYENTHIIGYKRIFSNIRDINKVAKLLKEKTAELNI